MSWKKRRCPRGFVFKDRLKSDLAGAAVAREFFLEVAKNTTRYFKKWVQHASKYEEDIGICSEGELGSFVCPAINHVTKSFFIAEYEVSRKHQEGRRTKSKRGRVDYWANYRSSSFLVELKYGWMQFFPEHGTVVFQSWVAGRMKNAVRQLHEMEKKHEFKAKTHLYALALLVGPVLVRDEDSEDPPECSLDNEAVESFFDGAEGIKANMAALWKVPRGRIIAEPPEFTLGMAFLGHYFKVSKG